MSTQRKIWFVIAISALAALSFAAYDTPRSDNLAQASAAATPSTDAHRPSANAATPEHKPAEPLTPADRYTIPNLDNPRIAAEVARVREIVRGEFAARDGQRYQVNNLALEFASLAKQAMAGDLMAARTLLESLSRCNRAARTPDNLERRVDVHYRDLAQPKPSNHPLRVMHEASIARAIDDYRHCAGVTDEQLASRGRWVTKLAEAGDAFARFQYKDFARPTDNWTEDYQDRLRQFQQQAWRYLEMELDSGNALALSHMGFYHADPRIIRRDPFKMYLYWYAYAQTPETPAHQSTYMGLNTAAAALTPEQIAEAERQGRALYERCCKR